MIKLSGKELNKEIKDRVKKFYTIDDNNLSIDNEAKIYWDTSPIGWLTQSDDPLKPNIQIIQSDLLIQDQIFLITERIKVFLDNLIQKHLSALIKLNTDEKNNSSRGIIYQIKEGFGSTKIKNIIRLLKDLQEDDKKNLNKLGFRFGVEYLYIPDLLKPGAVKLRALLWGIVNNTFYKDALPEDGRVAYSPSEEAPKDWYNIIGYSKLGDRVMRVDMVERLLALIRIAARDGSFKITEEMLSIAGASKEQM